MTYCRLAPEKRKPAWACGSAMFTIVASQNDHQLLIATPILAVASECEIVTSPPLLRHLAIEPAGLVHGQQDELAGWAPQVWLDDSQLDSQRPAPIKEPASGAGPWLP
jgi:hypothetical protein